MEAKRSVSGAAGFPETLGSCNGCSSRASTVLEISLKSVVIRVCHECAKEIRHIIAEFLR